MNSFRMLLASSDPEYDRALSLWLRKKCPPFETDCLDPQRWFEETEESFDAYDRILLGGSLNHIHQGPGVRIAGGFGDSRGKAEDETGWMDPYRPGEEVFRDLVSGLTPDHEPLFRIRTIGFLLTDSNPSLIEAQDVILTGLNENGSRILRADLRDIPSNDSAAFRRDGGRTWDDFIYSCIYAQTPELLTDYERFAFSNTYGTYRYPQAPGPNPYRTLTDRELRRMYGRIREYCRADYFAATLPEGDSPVYPFTLNQMDLILVLYGEDADSCRRLDSVLYKLKEDTDPGKRILEICVSGRFADSDVPGLILHLEKGSESMPRSDRPSSRMPEDLTTITEFIDHECFI